ncbi:hypothetical protein [Brevibacterium senegalense]|uniref:hypothetical protein n=1 Tax=Brevibacterium senegalense TaxID=1033736 RepID=UPI0002D6B3CE|nr:hypothetical protein [Brevibacterium senegalense]
MNTTGPLEILVMIVLLLVVVGCAIVCVVAVRWLRRIALQVEEDQTTRRERDMVADEREAAADEREAAADEREAVAAVRAAVERDRDAARQLAEHEAVLDLRRIQRRVALAEEELATARLESVKAQTEAAKSQAETARAQTDLFRAQGALARAHEAAAQDGVRREESPTDPERAAGDLAAILRRLGLPTGLGDGSTAEDVSVSGLDPRVLRRLQGLIPPEVMRRLTSGRGPGDIESIGDWIRSQIEKSMEDGDGGAGRDGTGREGSGDGSAGRGAAGRRGAGRGGAGRRPVGFQREDASEDQPDAANASEDESSDLSDALPDVLADSGGMSEPDAATASPGGLDVSALIEEALRDRARRREGETPGAKGDEEPGADGREDPGADGGGGTAASSDSDDDRSDGAAETDDDSASAEPEED